MNYIFSFKTESRKTYSVSAESREEAAKLLIEDYEEGDEKYLIDSEREEWRVCGYHRTQTYQERIEGHIVDEFEDEQ